MSSIRPLLKKFDDTLQKYNPINYASLQPPLKRKDVEAYMDNWSVQDDNLKQLLCWKNGFNFRGRIQNTIFEWGAFLSVEKINTYFKSDYTFEFEVSADGKKKFIDLTENGSGDALLYNLQESEFGRIHLHSVALLYIDEPISYYDSIATMLKTEIAAYETGAYKVEEKSGWLNIDHEKLFSLARMLNKQSEYWKQNV